MKKVLITVLTASLFISCGRGNKAPGLAKEVCDCYSKANAMAPDDPKKTDAQNDCIKRQGEAWNKVKDDEKKSDEFNKIIGECGKELIRKSFGQ